MPALQYTLDNPREENAMDYECHILKYRGYGADKQVVQQNLASKPSLGEIVRFNGQSYEVIKVIHEQGKLIILELVLENSMR